jgi:hypothetical protein
MSGDDPKKIVEFPKAELPPEERARRLKIEVERLAQMPPTEWLYYLEQGDIAKKHDVPPATLKEMIETTIKANEKRAREDRAENRRSEQRVEKARTRARREEESARREQERANKEVARKQKEKNRAFAAIIKLPKGEREAKLRELAKKLDEDVELLRDELIRLVGDAEEKIKSGEVEPWLEPVDTRVLLSELETQFRRYIIVHREPVAIAITLWICFAWCHEIATYSPILVIQGGDTATAKTTASKVIELLTPRAYGGHSADRAARLRGQLRKAIVLLGHREPQRGSAGKRKIWRRRSRLCRASDDRSAVRQLRPWQGPDQNLGPRTADPRSGARGGRRGELSLGRP